jgi:hypothetical protein
MYWRDIANLITITNTVDEGGDTVQTEVKKQIYVNELAYRTKAFNQALSSGLKPSISLEVKKNDYNYEKRIEYNGIKYTVVDTAPSKNENIEIICSGELV